MESSVGKTFVTPMKIYLDTCHLINIAKLRRHEPVPDHVYRAYMTLDQQLSGGTAGLVFNMIAPLEWVDGRATFDSANQIAAVIDSTPLQYHYEGDTFVFLSEVLAECRRLRPELILPDCPILQLRGSSQTLKSTAAMLKNKVPDFVAKTDQLPHLRALERVPEDAPALPARFHVERAFALKQDHPETFYERVHGYSDSLRQDMDTARPGFAFDSDQVHAWMKRFLKLDKILASFNRGLDAEALIEEVEVNRCPATVLWLKAREKRIKKKNPVRDNDCDDWMSVVLVPYVDIFLTERTLAACLLEADKSLSQKVFYEPQKAADLLEGFWI